MDKGHVLYQNLGGDSGVSTCKIEEESIEVTFKRGGTYLYTFDDTGRENVERMKILACAGQGLNAFINAHVKKLYAEKLR
ncbi:hypothetical protein WMF28_30275 [Sorangium sp. So ce590]|uniref:hypothetical protein n=1 Tax=Sorangium sp. So ce590 TaxID=3133317 RepID=UPI003F5E5041